MNIGVANVKGGATKTTTAVHLAGFFHTKGPTALLDADRSHNAEVWQKRGPGFGFPVVDVRMSLSVAKNFDHFITDSGSDPTDDDLKYLAHNCDLLVIPTKPHPLETDGLMLTLTALNRLEIKHFKVLLSCCPPDNEPDARELREALEEHDVPMFKQEVLRTKAFIKAAGEGVLVRDLKGPYAERAWAAYRNVGKECFAYANGRR